MKLSEEVRTAGRKGDVQPRIPKWQLLEWAGKVAELEAALADTEEGDPQIDDSYTGQIAILKQQLAVKQKYIDLFSQFDKDKIDAYAEGRKQAFEEAAKIAEDKYDYWQEWNSDKWPEMQVTAEEGCLSVEVAIRKEADK